MNCGSLNSLVGLARMSLRFVLFGSARRPSRLTGAPDRPLITEILGGGTFGLHYASVSRDNSGPCRSDFSRDGRPSRPDTGAAKEQEIRGAALGRLRRPSRLKPLPHGPRWAGSSGPRYRRRERAGDQRLQPWVGYAAHRGLSRSHTGRDGQGHLDPDTGVAKQQVD